MKWSSKWQGFRFFRPVLKAPIVKVDVFLSPKDTDESKKIIRLLVYQDGIGWFIETAKKEGILLERTYGDDPNGDIFCPDPEKIETLKDLARKLKEKYSKP